MQSGLQAKQQELYKVLEKVMTQLGIRPEDQKEIATELVSELGFRVALIKPNDPDTHRLLGIACQQKALVKSGTTLTHSLNLTRLLDGSVEFSADERLLLSNEIKKLMRETLMLRPENRGLGKEALEKKLDKAMQLLSTPSHEATLASLEPFALSRMAGAFSKSMTQDTLAPNKKSPDKSVDPKDFIYQQQLDDFSMRYGGGSKIPGGICRVVLAIVAGNQRGFIDLDNDSGKTFQYDANSPTLAKGDPIGTHALSIVASLCDSVITTSEEKGFSSPTPFHRKPSGPGGIPSGGG